MRSAFATDKFDHKINHKTNTRPTDLVVEDGWYESILFAGGLFLAVCLFYLYLPLILLRTIPARGRWHTLLAYAEGQEGWEISSLALLQSGEQKPKS